MKLLRWVPIVLWVLIICWLSFTPLTELKIKPPIGADKFAHIGMYGVLGLISLWTGKKRLVQILLLSFCFILAGMTEVIQLYFVENRTGDVFDFLANSIGIFGSMLIAKWAGKLNI